MNKMATITSKMQLTIPVQIARKIGIKEGEKVIVSEDRGRIIITPAEHLVEELAGSLAMPKKWADKTLDQIIEQSKQEYFKDHKK